MKFKQAYREMSKGKKVKRPGWKDVWFTISNGGSTILRTVPTMYKGTITGFELLTLENVENVCADDWGVVEEKKTWWKPKNGETYYFIRPDGDSDWLRNQNDRTDEKLLPIGNCFQTKEQAEFMAEKLKVIHELEKFAYENNEEEIDWKNKTQCKYYLVYDTEDEELYVDYTAYSKREPFNIYFTSSKIAKRAIEAVGEDRIKKYFFNIK